jgi:hypothetical protein
MTVNSMFRNMTATARPAASRLRGRLLPLAAGVALAAASVQATPAQLKPFTATYEVSYMGIGGIGTMTLAPAGGDRWNYRLQIDSAVATLSQRTTFAANGGTWRPLSNDDSSSLLIKKNSRQATYDWNSREARWSGDVKPDRSGPVALRDGDLDAMLVNLAIPRDVAAGKPLAYRMVDNGRARDLSYQVVGKESVEVGGKAQAATKVARSDNGKEQIIWVVDGLPVPARILQRRDGKDEMDLKLRSIR